MDPGPSSAATRAGNGLGVSLTVVGAVDVPVEATDAVAGRQAIAPSTAADAANVPTLDLDCARDGSASVRRRPIGPGR
ncbi:hypothetical protein [Embleya sp. MST-111070]|uniref:hypothetical protein n=1 Tax=Embleya sp. MST-111070 TaxID=3398231 RepID=UPI003F7368D7